jgi:hypothetical protein
MNKGERRIIRWHVKRFWRTEQPPSSGCLTAQEEFCRTVGKGRLANAPRAGNQPGMMEPSALKVVEEAGLCGRMTDQMFGVLRVWKPFQPVRLR